MKESGKHVSLPPLGTTVDSVLLLSSSPLNFELSYLSNEEASDIEERPETRQDDVTDSEVLSMDPLIEKCYKKTNSVRGENRRGNNKKGVNSEK